MGGRTGRDKRKMKVKEGERIGDKRGKEYCPPF